MLMFTAQDNVGLKSDIKWLSFILSKDNEVINAWIEEMNTHELKFTHIAIGH